MEQSEPNKNETTSSLTSSEETEEFELDSSSSNQDLQDLETVNEDNAVEDGKRTVSFGTIRVREYARCIGDNPATSYGPALSLDWGYNEAGVLDMEEYEENRPPRRAKNAMLVPSMEREKILMEHTNATRREVKSSANAIQAARHKRQMSAALQEIEDYQIFFEAIARRFRRLRSGVSKKREMELLWENAGARSVQDNKLKPQAALTSSQVTHPDSTLTLDVVVEA